jgi:outer membrane lipoprotein SlyB
MPRKIVLVSALTAVLLASGCAVQPATRPQPPTPSASAFGVEYGQVQSIDVVRAESQTSGGGALLGGLIGAVVGRQIGSASGRDAGTVVGAFGGAVIGNQIEKTNRGVRDFYRVAIVTRSGQVRTFGYQQLADLRVGDRVRIEQNQVYRD